MSLSLAERGVCLSNRMWVREIGCLDEKGHQTPMLSTDFTQEMDPIAVSLFARWCQENFFQYMGQHYGLDRLAEYGTEPLPDTTQVVNPAWRRADAAVRRERALLSRAQAEFGACQLSAGLDAEAVADFERRKGEQLERIRQQEQTLENLKKGRKETPHHVPLKDLPETERFDQLNHR